ncbi:hypothetical protein [Rossellomorea yichunensis]|uniref:hypothetical protein n=1 Tax=Rossellomorea yichunensis TaxID=3077331 RepID=UPI0028DE9583|nr:hypothetical protein [Rossellomorea sp. YC4-1]MDT9027513.1 hypothetical protein [Rossellomorea sp. YC4-1]
MQFNVVSDKRMKVLRLIDRFGVIGVTQLETYSGMAIMTIYRARKQLEELNFIENKSFGRQKVCVITKEGSDYVGSLKFGGPSGFSSLQHDLTVAEILFIMKKRYLEQGKDLDFKTERELTREYTLTLANQNQPMRWDYMAKNVPDFSLFNEERRVAYEVELSSKTNARIIRKMKQYQELINSGHYTHVIYLCKDQTILKSIQQSADGVGVKNLRASLIDQVLPSNEE